MIKLAKMDGSRDAPIFLLAVAAFQSFHAAAIHRREVVECRENLRNRVSIPDVRS